MKPFNLEAAKAGAPLVTRDGRAVKFVAHVPEANADSQLVVLIGTWVYILRADGALPHYNGPVNLFMAEEEITVYFNEYKNGVFGVPVRDEGHLPTLPHVVKTHAVQIKV